ncbi:hypothetical protein STAS_12895 [Striga asiatica]|uniref:Senescence regulator S40 n=1 Tax=Striga asiatica TaxID=4170 RepID=A0A5A7PV50_STRAF|nr:hypothetical protein STAS_12895 [Striga asiatica]
MEQLPGIPTSSRRRRHHHHPSADRFLGMLQPPPSSGPTPPLEISEHDIFNTPLECPPPSPTRPIDNSDPKPTRSTNLKHYGILAALTSNHGNRSVAGPNSRPLFNHKASPGAQGLSIPKPPPIQGGSARFRPQSAPVNIPVMPAAMRRRALDLEDNVAEREENADEMILPPHEVVAARHMPRAACSVMEGAGRTLKGRDLRQVRNAIWRKTGFID